MNEYKVQRTKDADDNLVWLVSRFYNHTRVLTYGFESLDKAISWIEKDRVENS